MKKFILTLLFISLFSIEIIPANEFSMLLKDNSVYELFGIDDGWYEATVKYTNYSTWTTSSYILDVYVSDDRVTTIDFGNDGSFHTGFNSDGYLYSGGYFSFEKDYAGNITAATTTVTVTFLSGTSGTKQFKIRIE